MNTHCTEIVTQADDERLLRLMLGKDNADGPLGSGGYRIQRLGPAGDAAHLSLTELDCTPARTFHAFIRDGSVWTTYASAWVMELLAMHGIGFSCRRVENPEFIQERMGALCAR